MTRPLKSSVRCLSDAFARRSFRGALILATVGLWLAKDLRAVEDLAPWLLGGAALLIFSQIFKKPLQGMTEVFYQINGGWDDPSIERTDSARFAATAELAGCLVDTGAQR